MVSVLISQLMKGGKGLKVVHRDMQETLAMISMIWKIKTESSSLTFYVETVQFILYKHLQNNMGDCFKTISLHPVKPPEEPEPSKEKEKKMYVLPPWKLINSIRKTFLKNFLSLERKKKQRCA